MSIAGLINRAKKSAKKKAMRSKVIAKMNKRRKHGDYVVKGSPVDVTSFYGSNFKAR